MYQYYAVLGRRGVWLYRNVVGSVVECEENVSHYDWLDV